MVNLYFRPTEVSLFVSSGLIKFDEFALDCDRYELIMGFHYYEQSRQYFQRPSIFSLTMLLPGPVTPIPSSPAPSVVRFVLQP